MSKRLLYVTGRNADFAGSISCHNGQILINLKNYTRVYDQPVKSEMADEFCFPILVPESKVKEVREGAETILRVWDGPLISNQYPQYKVRADVFNMETPMAAGSVSPAMVTENQDLKTEIAKLREVQGALISERDEARKTVEAGNDIISKVRDDIKQASATIAQLRDELVQAKSGKVIREVDVKLLAQIIQQAPDKILEEMPHCGPETVSHFKNWAEEFLAGAGCEE